MYSNVNKAEWQFKKCGRSVILFDIATHSNTDS